MKTLEEIKEANIAAGYHWFDEATMKGFGTLLHGPVFGDGYFVSSDSDAFGEERRYTIRRALSDGRIQTIGKFLEFDTLSDAKAELDRLLNDSD